MRTGDKIFLNGDRWERIFLNGLISFSLLLLCGVSLLPLLTLFLKVNQPYGDWDFRFLREILAKESIGRAALNTLTLATAVAGVSVLIGTPLAWLLARTNVLGRRYLTTWLCLPYAIPPYVGAIAWITLANPTNGLLNSLLSYKLFNIYSFTGLIWVEASVLYTFVFLNVQASLLRMDPALEESARVCGASPWRVFSQITLPLLRPSLLRVALLVALAAAASFGVPALIGGPGRIYLLTTQIFQLQKMGSIRGLYQAGALSLVLLGATVLLLLVTQALGDRRQIRLLSGKSSGVRQLDLGVWRFPLSSLVLLACAVFLLLPLGGLAGAAFNLLPSQSGFSPRHFKQVFLLTEETGRAFKNSIYLSVVVATFATLFGSFLAFLYHRGQRSLRAGLDILINVPYSLPGTAVAFAFILTFSQARWGLPSLYNSLILIGLAYWAKFLSLSVRTLTDGFAQIDPALAEAAQVCGAGPLTTFWKVWLPLLRPAMIAAWFLVFMPATSELTMTILLTGPGLETIGTLIFQLQEYADPTGGSAPVLALCLVIFVFLCNTGIKWFSGGRYGL